MAEHIYSKGTRVWFSDKEQGWISAEVTSVTRGADDSFKLGFVDERGKVRGNAPAALKMKYITFFYRKSPSIPLQRTSKMERGVYLR